MLRSLDFEHAEINGERITDPLFEDYYYAHRTHMLDNLERFYEAKIIAGIMSVDSAISKVRNNVPIGDPGDEQPTIRLRDYEIDHIAAHLSAWGVRERRMDRYNRRGQRDKARSLEDIYDNLSLRKREERQAQLRLIGDSFPTTSS